MDGSAALTIEGENYEVVDEYIKDEDASNSTKNEAAEGSLENDQSKNAGPGNDELVDDDPSKSKNEAAGESLENDKSESENPKDCEVVDEPVKDEDLSNSTKNATTAGSLENDQSKSADPENYEVVDEYAKDEDPSNTTKNGAAEGSLENDQLKSADPENENPDLSDEKNSEQVNERKEEQSASVLENAESNDTGINNSVEQNRSIYGICSAPYSPNNASIDFSADISLDQLDEEKSVMNKNISCHFNQLEQNMLSSCTSQENEKDDECMEAEPSSIASLCEETIRVKEKEKLSENDEDASWYEKKLAEKTVIVKERLSKLARVLGISYPMYETWLKKMEEVHGTPVCKLEPVRRCKLNKPYSNRWKFICTTQEIETPKTDSNTDGVEKSDTKMVWKLEPSGAWGVNVNKESDLPSFVLRAVKVFEEFLQSTIQSDFQEPSQTTENSSNQNSLESSAKKETPTDGRQQWLWLLVRCNSMDELMLFATGKNIGRDTMDRLKYLYESGAGKDCNVKSLYCKSINKCNDSTVTDTTFLVGSEALDEVVGGIKVQLAPKTNFWSNSAGAENIAKTVSDLLVPTSKTTILEIGCGIGLIGLTMASKCHQLVGVDSASEVEEAEMTCELNNIKNACFITGTTVQLASKIRAGVKNRRARAIINGNTNIGRELGLMACLRRAPSLNRIAMVTTLTKQSVRAILELARPLDVRANKKFGHPFLPMRACLVDTLPIGPHFEVVILMDRVFLHHISQPWFLNVKNANKQAEKTESTAVIEKTEKPDANASEETGGNASNAQTKEAADKTSAKSFVSKKGKTAGTGKKFPFGKNSEKVYIKGWFKNEGKRPCSPERTGSCPPTKMIKKSDNKFGAGVLRSDTGWKKKKRNWPMENPRLRPDVSHEKKVGDQHKEQTDLRERLSNNRINTDIAQKIKEHQTLLEMAKEKLSGPTPTIDITTAKQLQNMLNMVLEQTNKLQNQLPRSVWNRMSGPEGSANRSPVLNEPAMSANTSFRGRYVQEMGTQDILITAANEEFVNNDEATTTRPYKECSNVPPLEPNLALPSDFVNPIKEEPITPLRGRYAENRNRVQQHQGRQAENTRFWGRDKTYEGGHHWNETASPLAGQFSASERSVSPIKPQMPPGLRRPFSVNKAETSTFGKRGLSPVRPVSPPPRREMPPAKRGYFEVWDSNRISPGRRTGNSPERRFSLDRSSPPPRQNESLGKPYIPQMHAPQKFNDNWDMPANRRIGQQSSSAMSRPPNNPFDNVWKKEKSNFEQPMNSDGYRRSFFGEDKWAPKGLPREESSPVWNTKQMFGQSGPKETYSKDSANRCLMPYGKGSFGDNWNARGKSGFAVDEETRLDLNGQQNRQGTSRIKDSWNRGEKEDWNDLPEDARDPWGDDNNLDLKERWLKMENSVSTPMEVWSKNNERNQSWSKSNDNWHPKNPGFGTKPQWQSNSNPASAMGESRWLSQNDFGKKIPSHLTNRQGASYSTEPQQRFFNANQFKDLR